MMWARALMAASAATGFVGRGPAAVPGMNCAIPCAPAPETANGLKFDSAYSCEESSAAEKFQRCAAVRSKGAYFSGTKPGTAPCDAGASPSSLPLDLALSTYP